MFFSIITSNLLWTESLWIVLILAAAGLLGFFVFKPLFYLSLILFFFCFYFFRNPERVCVPALTDASVLVCPADGTIVDISHDSQGGFNGYHYKISIFLSPLNVHVNWIPMTGIIEKILYVPGTFMMAFLPKSSELNEHNDIVIRNAAGQHILVRQIAGTVARRIVCWVHESQNVAAGQKYGMIKFSSRVDILLPGNVTLDIHKGQSVYGGQTVIGRLR
jgi:phosphatidylserine decarboxylase